LTARLGLALGLLLPLFGCTAFPEIESGVCGNAVIDENEDCDTFAQEGHKCRAPGSEGPCRYDCSEASGASCPGDMGCGAGGICRYPTGDFEKGVNIAPGASSWLGTADFDGDGRPDVISTEPADEFRQARFRVHYFDAAAKLEETRTFPRVVTRPIARRLAGNAAADLVFSNGLIGMVPGRLDREWVPAAFSSYVLPGTRLRAASVRADDITGTIGLAIFSDLERGPGVYVPSIDNSSLLLSAPLERPFEELVQDPFSADIVTGPDSPCSEVVYAFLGDDSVHVLDLCELGTEPFKHELAWRERAIDRVVYLPGGATVTSAPQASDIDGDGHLDILVGSGYQTFVAHGVGSELEAEASQLFLREPKDGSLFPLSPPLASGDFTGDGIVDFVMPTGLLNSYTSAVDGQLAYFTPYENPAKPWSMAVVADLNGNGLPDVIAGTEGSPGLSFLSGTGGPFPNLTPLGTRGPLRSLTVGDFDGDRLFDVGYVQGGPVKDLDDSLAIAFGRRDTFPLPGSPIANVPGLQQLGCTTQRGGSSLFIVSRDEVDGVTRSKFSLFDGSSDRLPFAAYSLVTFSVDGSLKDSAARVLAAGSFTAPGANDLFVLGGDPKDPKVWSMWLVPDIGGTEKPPQLLTPDQVPAGAQGKSLNEEGGQLSAAAAAVDLEGDGFDEVVVLMPKVEVDEEKREHEVGCYLMIYDLDAAASTAASKGQLLFDTPCRDPEIVAADLDGDEATDLLVVVGDWKLGPRQLRILFNDTNGGFSLDESALVDVGGHDVRGVSVFTKQRGRLALVTDDGLYQLRVRRDRALGPATKLHDFVDARSVVVTNPDNDNVEDLAVADVGGVWLLKARLEAGLE